jgi:hypothetical protein
MLLPGLGLVMALLLWTAPIASAAGPYSMTISTAATSGSMTFTGGTYTPTANGANLNVTDLVTALGSGNVNVGDGGTITVESSIDASGSSGATDLTFDGPVTSSAAVTITSKGSQSYDGAVTLGGDATLASTDGSLTLASTVDGDTNLTLNAVGNVSLDGAVGGETALASLAITATTIGLGASQITTTGSQTYGAPVTLYTGVDATSQEAGAIGFGSTIDGAQALTVSTGGTVDFAGAIGGITKLTSLAIPTGAAAIDLGASQIKTTGPQTYVAPVTLSADVTATSSGAGAAGDITFDSTIDGTHALIVSTPGTVDFAENVGVATELASLSILAAAVIDLGGSEVSTSGTQTYGAPVTLNDDFAAASSGTGAAGDITFESTVDGAQALTVSTVGNLDFEAAIGGITPLTSLDIPTGGSTDLSGNVTTTGAQAFGQVALQSNVTFSSGSAVTFNNVVSGAHQLTMSGGGVMSLTDTASSYSGGTVVTGGSTLSFLAGTLTETGDITLNDGTLMWETYGSPNTDDISSQLQPIGAGGGTLDTNGNDVTLADAFGGSGPLIKTGAGTLTLPAAAGTYGDQLIVQGGAVDVPSTATISTPVLIQSGGALSCNDGTLTGGVTNQGGTATGAPAPPTNVTASLASRTATIGFTPGAANCFPVTYTATSGALSFGPASASPITAAGLAAGQPFTFKITATNPIGSSSASSNAVITASVPTVTITSPVNDGTITQGQVVDASYTCADGSGGPGIASCSGPVASGSALNTQTLGEHSFTVTALSSDGYSATATATYDVVAAKVPAPVNRFVVKQLKGQPSGSLSVSLASLSGRGTVKVSERPAGLRAFSVSKTTGTKTTFKFTADPSSQLKTWLKRHHRKLSVKVTITYTPRGGKARSVTRTVRL